jgi:protein-tyrosine phosphatase
MSEHENMHPPVGNYLWLPFVDGDAPKFTEYIPRAVEFIRFQTGKTLVHCAAGQSRSVSMVLAYMCEQDPPRSKEDIEQKISQLRAARPIIEPKQVFLHEIAIRHGITI